MGYPHVPDSKIQEADALISKGAAHTISEAVEAVGISAHVYYQRGKYRRARANKGEKGLVLKRKPYGSSKAPTVTTDGKGDAPTRNPQMVAGSRSESLFVARTEAILNMGDWVDAATKLSLIRAALKG